MKALIVATACALLAVGCNGPPGTDSGTDTATDLCEGAALEYHRVCFFSHSVEAMGHEHPLDLDDQPGHELVGVDDGKVSVHEWSGSGFVVVGEAALPGEVDSSINAGVLAGEFDDVPGLDLVVSESGEWAALYHVDATGALTLVGPTTFLPANPTLSQAFQHPVAVGPDASGRWRVIAHYDNGGEYVSAQPLAVWEMEGTVFVGNRLELPTEACSLQDCASGEFNGDGRQDAICTIADWCPTDPPEEDIVHVVLLAQADGSVAMEAYPTKDVSTSFVAVELNGDAFTDLLGWTAGWYRLADGMDGLGSVVLIETPDAPDTGWKVVSVGDLDGNNVDDIVLGDSIRGLVFADLVGSPQAHEMLQVQAGTLEFKNTGMDGPIDVNGDGVVELPMRDEILLVSEVLP